jgi:cardiolipin synthase (CMP-forming)
MNKKLTAASSIYRCQTNPMKVRIFPPSNTCVPAPVMAKLAEKIQIRPLLGTFWTVANVLSLLRMALVVPVVYLILVDGPMPLLIGLIILVIVSDWIDGWVARSSHTVSEWGKVLDPLADKVAAAAVAVALVVRGAIPMWFLMLLLGRDMLILMGGTLLARRTGHVVMSMWSGKVAVFAVSITLLAAVLRADPPVLQFCIWTSTTLLVFSFMQYAVRFGRLLRKAPGNDSPPPSHEDEHPVSIDHQGGSLH